MYQPPTFQTLQHLPFDILTIILEFTLSLEQTQNNYFEHLHDAWLDQLGGLSLDSLPDPYAAQRRLGSVCKTWRSAIQLIPSAWSRIVYISPSTGIQRTAWTRGLQELLSSSRQISLDVTLWISGGEHIGELKDPDYIYARLLRSSHRWRSLRLYVGAPKKTDFLVGPLSDIFSNLPNLKSLSIACDDSNIPPNTSITLKDLPSLYSLEMSGIAPRSLSLPWQQIRELKIQCMQFKDAVEAATLCSKMEKWVWKAQTIPIWSLGLNSSTSPKLELASLTSLSLETTDWRSGRYLPSVLSRFSLPQLQQLAIVVSSLYRSTDRLGHGSSDALADALLEFPNLQDVHLSV